MKIHIETSRLLLRDILPADDKGMFKLDSDPEVHKYLGKEPVTSLEQSQKVISMIRKQYKENGIGRWAVLLKESKEFIGWAGLKLVNEMEINGRTNFYDLGYRYQRAHWGKGYGTEAAKAILDYGFNVMGLEEISAFLESGNEGSKNILGKIGLQHINSFEAWGDDHDWFEIKKEGKWFPRERTLPSGEQIIVRQAEAADAAALVEYVNAVGGETDFLTFGGGEFNKTEKEEADIVESYKKAPNEIFFIAKIEDEIAGIINLGSSHKKRLEHVGEFGITVRKHHWGKGIASLLLQSVIDWAKVNPFIRKINLKVSENNDRAIALYEKLGFEKEGVIRRDLRVNGTFYSTIAMGLLID